jgi:hypothetical protein
VVALVVAIGAAVFEVVMMAREAELLQLLLLPLVAAMIFLGAIYRWGCVAHGAVQLRDDHLLLWDWRNRAQRFAYGDLAAVACATRFRRWTTIRVAHGDGNSTEALEWLPVVTWRKDAPAAIAVAAEVAQRAGLQERAEGMWTRAYAEDLPPTPLWE